MSKETNRLVVICCLPFFLGLLATFPAAAQDHPDIAGLRRALASLPQDRISFDQLQATCGRNVESLSARGLDLRASFDRSMLVPTCPTPWQGYPKYILSLDAMVFTIKLHVKLLRPGSRFVEEFDCTHPFGY